MASDTVLGVEWSKSNPVAPRGRGVWTIPLNDIPSLGNRKQDSTSSPKQVPFLLRTAKRHPIIRRGKCFYNNRLSRSYCTHEDNGTPEGQLCYPHTTGSGLAFSAHYPRLFTRRLLSGHCAGEFWTPCLESVRLRFTEGWRQLQTGYMLSYKEIKPSKKSFCQMFTILWQLKELPGSKEIIGYKLPSKSMIRDKWNRWKHHGNFIQRKTLHPSRPAHGPKIAWAASFLSASEGRNFDSITQEHSYSLQTIHWP